MYTSRLKKSNDTAPCHLNFPVFAKRLLFVPDFIANLTSYAALIQSIDQDVYEERFDKKRKR
jgi:hypothetical protein